MKSLYAAFFLIMVQLISFAQSERELWPGNARVGGNFRATNIYGMVGGATVSDTAGNFASDDLESILAWLATQVGGGGETGLMTANNIIFVTDTVTSGGTFWQWEFPDWDQEDSVYYDKRWRERPTLTIGYGGEFTQYGVQLPGVTTGSDRGIRVNLSSGNSFSDSWEIRLFGVLEDAAGIIYPVAAEGFGLIPPSRPATRRMSKFLGR